MRGKNRAKPELTKEQIEQIQKFKNEFNSCTLLNQKVILERQILTHANVKQDLRHITKMILNWVEIQIL